MIDFHPDELSRDRAKKRFYHLVVARSCIPSTTLGDKYTGLRMFVLTVLIHWIIVDAYLPAHPFFVKGKAHKFIGGGILTGNDYFMKILGIFSCVCGAFWQPWPAFSFSGYWVCHKNAFPWSQKKNPLWLIFSLDPLWLFQFDYSVQWLSSLSLFPIDRENV